MRRCQIDCEFISELDLFGKEPEFFYKGKSQKTSYVGRILSVLYAVLYVAFFIYKLVRMVNKLDIDFYETNAFTGIPSIPLNNQNFYAGFSIGGIIDKTLYYPAIQYWVETRTDGIKNAPYIKNIDLEVCQLDKFEKNHQSLLKDKPLENFYCIKDVQEDLIGYGSLDAFSYYYIMIFPCIDNHPDGTPCQPLENVTTFFQKTFLEFTVQDIELTPKDYDKPSVPLIKDITTPVFQHLYQSIYGYFQIVNLETNLDVLGFEALSDIKYDKFLKYDQSWIIAAPSPHSYGLQKGIPVCDVVIQLSAKVSTIIRSNTKLIDVLGDVGGFMEFIYSLFNIISMFITDLLYDIDIVNNLFSFDLTKKKVLIKYKKKEEKENIDNAPLNIFEPKIIENNIMNLNENIQNDIKKDENSLINTQEISAKKKKKRSSRKLYSSNLSNIQNNKEEKETAELNEKKNLYKKSNSIINQKNGTMFSNDRIIPDSRNKNNSADKKEETMIKENVDINNFFIIFAFCCIRKIKNVNSYVLEEGLNIIKERLDVLNIFTKLYYDEKIQESFKNKENEIEMSIICKNKLE
jgi:hypothetical protein